MRIDTRYAQLFEPLKRGPVTAPNRFYQVPHCTGMGHALPRTLAAMRGIKAEGGWGVVCTEYCSIHPSSDDHPFPFASNWDEGDLANLAAIADADSVEQARIAQGSATVQFYRALGGGWDVPPVRKGPSAP